MTKDPKQLRREPHAAYHGADAQPVAAAPTAHRVDAEGLVDVFRNFDQPEKSFSWWDYRAQAFRRNRGLRIDLILASQALAEKCTAAFIDTEPRKHERPSDHTPVCAEFSL